MAHNKCGVHMTPHTRHCLVSIGPPESNYPACQLDLQIALLIERHSLCAIQLKGNAPGIGAGEDLEILLERATVAIEQQVCSGIDLAVPNFLIIG